jgi:hypothetical protein
MHASASASDAAQHADGGTVGGGHAAEIELER